MAVIVSSLLVVSLPSAEAQTGLDRPEDSQRTLPYTWAPTYIVDLLTNANGQSRNSWDVAYWVNFGNRAGAMSSPFFTTSTVQGTIEFGWKDTGHYYCDDAYNVVKHGWPDTNDVRVDWTEDSDDAIIWVTDLHELRNDQLFNQNKEYFISYDCDYLQTAGASTIVRNDDFREIPNKSPRLEAQLGRYIGLNDPISTFSVRGQTIIPNEQGWRGVPLPADNRLIQTNADLPWNKDWAFENGQFNVWTIGPSTITARYCADGKVGHCYEYIAPSSTAGTHSTLSQTFTIPSVTTKGRVFSGSNTDYTVTGWFRCPVWSPGHFKPSGGSSCKVRVGLRPINSSTIEWETVTIPATHSWKFAQTGINSSTWDWSAHSSDDQIEVIVDTLGYGVDVDAIWVSSGL